MKNIDLENDPLVLKKIELISNGILSRDWILPVNKKQFDTIKKNYENLAFNQAFLDFYDGKYIDMMTKDDHTLIVKRFGFIFIIKLTKLS